MHDYLAYSMPQAIRVGLLSDRYKFVNYNKYNCCINYLSANKQSQSQSMPHWAFQENDSTLHILFRISTFFQVYPF